MSISADINTLRRDYAQRAETSAILSGHRWRSRAERATDNALRMAYEELAGRLDVLARNVAAAEAGLAELAATMREDFHERDIAGDIVRAYASRLDSIIKGEGAINEH